MKRAIWAVTIVVVSLCAGTVETRAQADCPEFAPGGGDIPSKPCLFLDLLNVPIPTTTGLFVPFLGGPLVVCNGAGTDDSFGVEWEIPTGPLFPPRTAHEDWDDIAQQQWQPTKNPDNLGGGTRLLSTTTNYELPGRAVEQRTIETTMLDTVDTQVDCNGSAAGSGSCEVINDTDPLVSAGADFLDFDGLAGADGTTLCADSLVSPQHIVIDDNGDCIDGAGGTPLLGSSQTGMFPVVTNLWGFRDEDGDDLLDDGEDLYIDVRPTGQYWLADSVVLISTNFSVIDATSVRYEVYDTYSNETNELPVVSLPEQNPINHPVQVEEFPIAASNGRFIFGDSVDSPVAVGMTLPDGTPTSGIVLGIAPEGGFGTWTGDRVKARTEDTATEQKDAARGSNGCLMNWFAVVDQSLGFIPPVPVVGRSVPALDPGAAISLILILILAGACALRRI